MGFNFLKLLQYLIKEVVMIVIGILIALQINNWDEDRKVEIEEINILKNLFEDLKSAKKQSENFALQEEKLKKSLFLALGKTENGFQTDFNKFINDSIFYELLWNFEARVPVINSYSDVKNTGKLGIIKNGGIRRSFTALELNINSLKFFIEDRLAVQQLRVDKIAINNVNFVRLLHSQDSKFNVSNEIKNNYQTILSDQKIRNVLAAKLELTNKIINYRYHLSDEIQKLMNLLNLEIKSRNTK